MAAAGSAAEQRRLSAVTTGFKLTLAEVVRDALLGATERDERHGWRMVADTLTTALTDTLMRPPLQAPPAMCDSSTGMDGASAFGSSGSTAAASIS